MTTENLTQIQDQSELGFSIPVEEAVTRHIRIHKVVSRSRIATLWGDAGLEIADRYPKFSYGPNTYHSWGPANAG